MSPDEQLVAVSNYDKGLVLVDISTPETPKEIVAFDVDTKTYGTPLYRIILISKDGKTVFAGTKTKGLFIFDITDPKAPKFVSQYKEAGFSYVYGLDLSPDGTKLFMACYNKGVWQMDLADLKNPKGQSLTPIGWSGEARGVKATSNSLLTAHYSNGLTVLSGAPILKALEVAITIT